MWERAKTALLVALIISSLVLTGQMRLAYYSAQQPGPPSTDLKQPEPLEVLSPTAIHVHTDRGSRLYPPSDPVYAASWRHFRNLVSGAAALTDLKVATPTEWERALRTGSVELKLGGQVQLRMWLEALAVQPSGLSLEHNVDRVLVSRHTNHVYFLNTRQGKYYVWENASISNQPSKVREETAKHLDWVQEQKAGVAIRQLTSAFRSRASAWVYVPSSPGAWPQLLVSHEKGRSQQLANSFFTDLSLVRRVGERDGRVSLTDGLRHVYLHADGTVQYVATTWFNSNPDTIYSYSTAALNKSLAFVARFGGWPEEVKLSLMEIEPKQGQDVAKIHFEFIPYTGITVQGVAHYVPIVSWRQQIAVTINEKEVSDYQRSLYHPIRDGASPTQIIAAESALRAIEKSLIPGFIISNVYLGYYQRDIDQPEEFLYPVWVIEQGEEIFMVNAFTGDVIAGPSAQITLVNTTDKSAAWDIGVPHPLSQYTEFKLEYHRGGQLVHLDQWNSRGGSSYSMSRVTDGLNPATTYTVYFYAYRGDGWRQVGAAKTCTTKARQ